MKIRKKFARDENERRRRHGRTSESKRGKATTQRDEKRFRNNKAEEQNTHEADDIG